MSNFPPLPEKHLLLLPPSVSADLASLKAKIWDQEAQCSAYPSIPLSISNFLDSKIVSLESRAQYLQKYRLAIMSIQREGNDPNHDSQAEQLELEEAECGATEEHIAIKVGRKLVHDDVDDKLRMGNPLEDAYTAAMVGRIRVTTGGQSALRFDRSKFKAAVLKYFDASIVDSRGQKFTWCHLLGPCVTEHVKAAHLVPKSLEEDSTVFLFGGEAKPATDVRNALLLYGTLEKRLDSGDIAIVPVAGANNEWKCVVTRKEKLNDTITQAFNVRVQLKDIHDKQLQFRSENRPAKRYLFFRYVMTYLRNKAEGNVEWAQTVEANIAGWLTPGRYLRNSTLRVLAKQFTGEDLPEEMLKAAGKLTFYDDEEPLLPRDLEKATRSERAALNLRMAALAPRTSDADDSDDEDSEEESDDGTN